MAHQVLDPENAQKILEAKKKNPSKVFERVIIKTKTMIPPVIDALILLTICFWYFFFTGLAILFRAPIPKEWLKIAQNLSKGKIAKKIQNLSDVEPEQKKSAVKIMDLETNSPLDPRTGKPLVASP